MREIKFRVWHKVDGMKYFGECMYHLLLNGKLMAAEDGFSYSVQELDRKRFKLMQYTGLKDKKGKEIYEGDILKDVKGDFFKVVFDNERLQFIGVCIKESIQCTDKEYQLIGDTTALYPSLIIIGNIHENPELLTDKNLGE